jgi:hypothetical protein
MRSWLVSLAAGALAVGSLSLTPALASADDDDRRGYWRHRSHDRFHDELRHREFHRDLEHREAHRFPMTWWEHKRLHDQIDHERFHDRLDHRGYHQDRRYYYAPYSYPSGVYYAPYGSNLYPSFALGYQGRNFSIYFAR